ncbi:MAG TPA: serine hydrolase [Solirubrobacteraceae bacterium]
MRTPTAEELVESIRPAGLLVARFGAEEDEIAAYGRLERGARVEIGSVTKLFTARLLTLLVDEGTVRLDEPATACLGPGWRLGGHATLERLACHRAGLPRLPRRAWRSVLRDGANPYRTLTVDDLRASLPPWLPRARWFRYSNFGAALLGHALAARTGVSWAGLIADRITAPLNVDRTDPGWPRSWSM